MATEESLRPFASNGVPPTDEAMLETPDMPPALLAQLMAKADMMWRETQRRDGNAVWHSWQWMRAFYVMLAVWLLTAVVGLWLYAHMRDVEVVVQTVVYNAEGQFVSLGVPQKLLAYEPEDGQWRDMLGEWIHKKQWRTEEASGTLTKLNWGWLYRHTCGEATKTLQQDEERDKPLRPARSSAAYASGVLPKRRRRRAFKCSGTRRRSTR